MRDEKGQLISSLIPPPSSLSQVRAHGCGKSAPAASRGVGSVNPGREQGRQNKGWSFSRSKVLGTPQQRAA